MESKLSETVRNILKHGFSIKNPQSMARITNTHAKKTKTKAKPNKQMHMFKTLGKIAHADRFGMQIIVA